MTIRKTRNPILQSEYKIKSLGSKSMQFLLQYLKFNSKTLSACMNTIYYKKESEITDLICGRCLELGSLFKYDNKLMIALCARIVARKEINEDLALFREYREKLPTDIFYKIIFYANEDGEITDLNWLNIIRIGGLDLVRDIMNSISIQSVDIKRSKLKTSYGMAINFEKDNVVYPHSFSCDYYAYFWQPMLKYKCSSSNGVAEYDHMQRIEGDTYKEIIRFKGFDLGRAQVACNFFNLIIP